MSTGSKRKFWIKIAKAPAGQPAGAFAILRTYKILEDQLSMRKSLTGLRAKIKSAIDNGPAKLDDDLKLIADIAKKDIL